MIGGIIVLDELLENKLFCTGMDLGINIYQQIVLTAYGRKEPLLIDGEPYYIQNGDELLQQMLDAVCNG